MLVEIRFIDLVVFFFISFCWIGFLVLDESCGFVIDGLELFCCVFFDFLEFVFFNFLCFVNFEIFWGLEIRKEFSLIDFVGIFGFKDFCIIVVRVEGCIFIDFFMY